MDEFKKLPFNVDDNVSWDDDGKRSVVTGKVRFIGQLPENDDFFGTVLGIDFDHPVSGGMNGVVGDRYMFVCKKGCGKILHPNQVTKIAWTKRRSEENERRYSSATNGPKDVCSLYNSPHDYKRGDTIIKQQKYGTMNFEEPRKCQEPLRVNICIEAADEVANIDPIPWKMVPSKLIAELKYEIEKERKIPARAQKWFVGRDVAEDTSKLSHYNVVEGTTIYICVTDAKDINTVEQDDRTAVREGESLVPNLNATMNETDGQRVYICVEDEIHHVDPLAWQMVPSKLIAELKRDIEEKLDIPARLQRWIIGRMLTEDTKTLASYDIDENTIIYINVMDAHTVHFEDANEEPEARVEARVNDIPILNKTVEGLNNMKRKEPEVQLLPGEWRCSTCTYINVPRLVSCEMCRAVKELIPDQDNEEADDNEEANDGVIDYNTQLQFINRNLSKQREKDVVGWPCPKCTFLNEPTRPGCEICSTERPADYQVPIGYQPSPKENDRVQRDLHMQRQFDEEKRSRYEELVELDDEPIAYNQKEIHCLICQDDFPPDEGIVLHNCLHEFCTDCIVGTIENSENVEIFCPYVDNNYKCPEPLQDREIRALLTAEKYTAFLAKCVTVAQGTIQNAFHCQTLNCRNWCEFEPGAREFYCELCQHFNCVACQVIHEGRSCREYQYDLKRNVEKLEEGKLTEQQIQNLLNEGTARNCPHCQALIIKNGGCNHMICGKCRKDFNWTGR